MRELVYLSVQPDDNYFIWQVNLWLESLKEIGESHKAQVLLFTPGTRAKNESWNEIIQRYPEAQFFWYDDKNGDLDKFIKVYIPVIRPYCLYKHFTIYPELKEKAVLYCDSDIIFMKKLDIDKYLQDDINYLSNTNSYISSIYFNNKEKDVISEKLQEYKTKDILNTAANLLGINREICEKNKFNSGGAQYLLKNIDASFWKNVLEGCIKLRLYFQSVNKEYFTSEDKGIQSWAADMWAVLWSIWKRNQETKVVWEMDFAWSSDKKTKLKECNILHNAGITSDSLSIGGNIRIPAFYKGKYSNNRFSPYQDATLDLILNDPRSKEYCFHYYLEKLLELKHKYNLK